MMSKRNFAEIYGSILSSNVSVLLLMGSENMELRTTEMKRSKMQLIIEYEGDSYLIDDIISAVQTAVEDTDPSASHVFADIADEEEIG